MASQLAWLAHDDAEMRRTMAAIEMFKDESTVDEIGIGALRDTISDVLFPGTSVLHTRARYLLFVPWLLHRTAVRNLPVDRSLADLRTAETQLIYALLAGGETDGVIGRQARERLKSMPSAAYWAATRRYGFRTWPGTVESYFRTSRSRTSVGRPDPGPEDPGIGLDATGGLDPSLPPAPGGLLETTTFTLTEAEAGYLADRLLGSTPGSMLAWLLARGDRSDVDYIWQHPASGEFPPALAIAVDHGRRLHTAMYGAALLYNLMLAEKAEADDLVDGYRDELAGWRDELDEAGNRSGWDRAALWSFLRENNPRISIGTQAFVNSWLDGLGGGGQVEERDRTRTLIRDRELQLKGARSRLSNPAALDNWSGGSGLARLDYRWSVARRLLADINAAPTDR